jgi:hypothetical protein
MRYCGVSAIPTGHLQLAVLEELRMTDPPVRLAASFYEPGTADQVAAAIGALGDAIIAIATNAAGGDRVGDRLLQALGVAPADQAPEAGRLFELLSDRGLYVPAADASNGLVGEQAWHSARVIETNADAIFCALAHRRLPARRHPFGVQLRIHELEQDHVEAAGGPLWHRRIEEIDAAGAGLCAHRYALGHACWVGDPREGVIVLPGTAVPERFTTEGVLPAVERLRLPAGAPH